MNLSRLPIRFTLHCPLLLLAAILPAQRHELLTAPSLIPYAPFGTAVAMLGDVDADGSPDLLIASRGTIDKAGQGFVEVRSGSDGLLLRRHVGTEIRGQFGSSVARLGDLDADGVDDYAVGAIREPYDSVTNQSGPGMVHVFSGKTGTRLYTIDARPFATTTSEFGHMIVATSDLNNDQVADFFVVARNGPGVVFLISGRDGKVLQQYVGNAQEGFERMALADDRDKDGKVDLWVMTRTSRRLVLLSAATGNGLQEIQNASRGELGGDLVSADVDADGTPDLVLGALREPYQLGNTSGSRGEVFCYSGKTGLRLWAQAIPWFGTDYGRALCVLGDVDRDGTPDVAVGALTDRNQMSYGNIDVLSAKSGSVLLQLSGAVRRDQIGTSLAAAGDHDGDGTPDFLVGASNYDNGQGAAYLLSTRPRSLAADMHAVSVLTGGHQILELNAGSAQGGRPYLVVGSASGTKPGLQIGSIKIPLNLDAYLLLSVLSPNHFIYNNLGALATDGRGTAAFVLPSGYSASLGGVLLHHAFVTIGPNGVEFASNAVPVRLTKF